MNWLRAIAYVTLLILIVPVLVLLFEGLGPLRTPAGYSIGVFKSIELSLISSAAAAIACVALFTPLSYYLARSQSKVGEALADVPASIPHPIVGVALLVLFSPLTGFGRFMQSIGINIFDTFLGLIIALTVISAPIYIKSMKPYFESMNTAHESFAQGLGASKLRAFVSVVLPNSGSGILSASLISMSRAMSEFGSIAIVAYEIIQPGAFFGVSPASVLIFNFYSSSGLPASATASAVMIIVSVPIMIGLRFVKLGGNRGLLQS